MNVKNSLLVFDFLPQRSEFNPMTFLIAFRGIGTCFYAFWARTGSVLLSKFLSPYKAIWLILLRTWRKAELHLLICTVLWYDAARKYSDILSLCLHRCMIKTIRTDQSLHPNILWEQFVIGQRASSMIGNHTLCYVSYVGIDTWMCLYRIK
jgi:hypothetical protein